MNINYIGHGTVLVDTGMCKFITDPLLVKRIARIGPKRKVPLYSKSSSLDDIDFITISHGHFDHLDLRSLQMIHQDVPVVCHTTLQRIVHKTKHKPIPLSWWDSSEINGIKITAVLRFISPQDLLSTFQLIIKDISSKQEKRFIMQGMGE